MDSNTERIARLSLRNIRGLYTECTIYRKFLDNDTREILIIPFNCKDYQLLMDLLKTTNYSNYLIAKAIIENEN